MAISLKGMGKLALALVFAAGLTGAAEADIPPETYEALGV